MDIRMNDRKPEAGGRTSQDTSEVCRKAAAGKGPLSHLLISVLLPRPLVVILDHEGLKQNKPQARRKQSRARVPDGTMEPICISHMSTYKP